MFNASMTNIFKEGQLTNFSHIFTNIIQNFLKIALMCISTKNVSSALFVLMMNQFYQLQAFCFISGTNIEKELFVVPITQDHIVI